MKRSPYYVGTLILSLAVLVIGFATYASFVRGHELSPLVVHAPCMQIAGGPSPLYACADRRAYVRQDGRWQDAGPLTAGPVVPAA